MLAGGGTTANNAAPFVLLLFMVAVSLLGPLLARLATEVPRPAAAADRCHR
ncbi:hypothetical protein LT493_25830 [Streptomyces tricolor]|nr:hypothetical protein [Streptomyces tricolor]